MTSINTITNKGIYTAASFLAAVLLYQEVPVVQCLVSSSIPAPPPRIRALRQVSSEPLAFIIDDFCDTATCADLEQNSQEARLHFATLIAGELFAGQWGKHDGLRYNLSQSSDVNNNNNSSNNNSPETELSGQCAEGLHVDTNNGTPFRSVTAILYLNDLPPECGAATVFPLAGATSNDKRLLASQRLLKDGIYHSRGSAYYLAKEVNNNGGDNEDGGNGNALLTPLQEADAALLESVASTAANGLGLRIQPQAGRLLLFFSRMDDGSIDPRSWHGGERLVPLSSTATATATVVDKKIMTLFKEVSYGTTPDHPLSFDGNDNFEQYLSHQVAEQRRSLRALAEAHAPFFAK